MMPPWLRRGGLPVMAALLLFAGASRLWSIAPDGVAAAWGLLGAGLIVLGFAVYDWIRKDD